MAEKDLIAALKELDEPFYSDAGFWISTIIGLVGIYLSYRAFYEAREAKSQAGKAADAVRRQVAVVDISEITRMCQLDESITYPEASQRINEVSAKVRSILGTYRSRLSVDNVDLLQQVEGSLINMRSALDTVNPLTDGEMRVGQFNVVYYTIETQFTSLVSALNELKGVLDGQHA